jgi:hypothetical protein
VFNVPKKVQVVPKNGQVIPKKEQVVPLWDHLEVGFTTWKLVSLSLGLHKRDKVKILKKAQWANLKVGRLALGPTV